MIIIGFGLNHKTAPLALLEQVSFTAEDMTDFLERVCDGRVVHEAFGLSTCNRTEFLLCCTDAEQARDLLLSSVNHVKGVDLLQDLDKTFFHVGEDAIRHIFDVACGIDSMVVGENEILGQLRRAREAASDSGRLGEVLDPILLRAIDIGRRARQSTGISRGNVSVASVAATLAVRTLGGDLSSKKGVILGAGKTAEAAAMQMSERGLKDLTIANRTHDRAFRVASGLGAREASLDDVGKLLQEADVLVCATSGQHFIVTVPMMNSAMGSRPGKPVILLDLSVPRNIDPEVAEIEGVHLYSLEHLSQVAEENRAQREMQMRAVKQLIDEEITAWHGLRQASDSGRLVGELHRRMEAVRQQYVERYAHHFTADEQQLDIFSAGLTRSILHELVENVKALDIKTPEGQRRYEYAWELFIKSSDRKKAENDTH